MTDKPSGTDTRLAHCVTTRRFVTAVLTAALLAACSSTPGSTSRPADNQVEYRVGGLPVIEGPSGWREDAPAPRREAGYSDGGAVDALVLSAVDDVEMFWQQAYPETFGAPFDPVDELVSYDSLDPFSQEVCGIETYDRPNAMWCSPLFSDEETIAWDRGFLVPTGQQYFGDTSVAALIAHEYGHAVQHGAEIVNLFTETIVKEQQADCFAGAYSRWVAEGRSPRFTLSTGDGLNRVLAGAISLADPVWSPQEAEMVEEGHGTALDRTRAFQQGFVDGTPSCTAIDLASIERERGDLPILLQRDSSGGVQTGELPLEESTLSVLLELLDQIYAPQSPPGLSFDGQSCPTGAASPPASYCPSTNTILVDLPALQAMSVPAGTSDYALPQGDNTGLSIVTSRYALSLQHAQGQPLDAPSTALLTACLTGVAQAAMADPIELPSGNSLQLAAGDIDEAVGGLLTNGLIASTIDGLTVPAGFTRIEAFRAGLSGSEQTCHQQY
ncbi:peptidase [Mycolicibacterium hippocampi]|uniref:peptidase n=1 Tax=Mycolicibacterium hippocampi TaxID=659824 RepID=UPI0023DEF193